MKTIIIIICTLSLHIVYGQKKNAFWVFGDSAGINFVNPNIPLPINSAMDGRGSCVSICDTNGNLVLYAATLGYLNSGWTGRVFNSINNIIQGCDSITGDSWYNELVCIPHPTIANQFYVCSIGFGGTFNYGCFYSLIDMSINNGHGGVIAQNIQLNNVGNGDCLTAIMHGNGRDWWLLSKYSDVNTPMNNRFFVYLVDSSGISLRSTQDFNDATDGFFQRIIVHPYGNKFMLINVLGYMAEFNFNRCSGVITLNKTIYPEIPSPWCCRYFIFGVYSPNGNVFYASTTWYGTLDYQYLLQYDLTDSNVAATCDTLETLYKSPFGNGALCLAPDNKIYFSHAYVSPNAWSYPYPDSMRNYINENLSVINEPDSLGAACDYQPFSFYLGGKRTYYGLPNNPDYELGPLVGSPCDTLSVNLTPGPSPVGEGSLYATYIAAWEKLYVNASGLKGKNVTVSVYDGRGSLMVQEFKSSKVNTGYFTLDVDCAGWASGLYVVHLETEAERLSKKFVKE